MAELTGPPGDDASTCCAPEQRREMPQDPRRLGQHLVLRARKPS